MEVLTYKDSSGVWFREVISNKNKALRELEKEYQKKGKRTWINIYQMLNNTWILTVELGAKI